MLRACVIEEGAVASVTMQVIIYCSIFTEAPLLGLVERGKLLLYLGLLPPRHSDPTLALLCVSDLVKSALAGEALAKEGIALGEVLAEMSFDEHVVV